MSCLNLQRNSEVYFSTVDLAGGGAATSMSPINTWKVEVLAGFAATAGADTQDITSMESGATPDRGQQRFNTAINPVDWNFQVYIRPTGNATRPLADWFLWQAALTTNPPADDAETQDSSWATSAIDTTASNFASAQELHMYLKLDQIYYQVKNATVNELALDAGIEEIAMTTWTGFGTELIRLESAALTAAQAVFVSTSASTDVTNAALGTVTSKYHPFDIIDEGGTDVTNAFIKNRLSVVDISYTDDNSASFTGTSLPVTALGFGYTNNITYLTPEELAALNVPIGQFTGTRAVTGSVTMYLRGNAGESADLLKLISGDGRTNTSGSASATLKIGGTSGPKVTLAMTDVQFSFPTLGIEDNIAITAEFLAQESDCGAADEVTITAAKT